MLRLEDDGLVPLAEQLERRDEAGDPAADDDDPLGGLRSVLEPFFGRAEGRLVQGAAGERAGLAGFGFVQLSGGFRRDGHGV